MATGSSALEVLKSSHDLSRRAIVYVYKMSGMSFREYLGLRYGINLEAVELKDLLASHQEMAIDIINALKKRSSSH